MLRRIYNYLFGEIKIQDSCKCKCVSTKPEEIERLTPELKDKLWEETDRCRKYWDHGSINKFTFVKLHNSDVQWLELDKKYPSYIELENETYFLYSGWSGIFPIVGKKIKVTHIDDFHNKGNRAFYEVEYNENPWEMNGLKKPIYWKYTDESK